jgi:tetratricopeptide (TPR) repeat protein
MDADALEPFIYSGTNDLRSAFAAQFQHSALLDLQGKLRLKKGEFAEAIAEFQAAVALSQNPAYMNDLAQALWVAGSKDEALEVWADAVATQIVPLSAIPEEPRGQLPDPHTFDRDWYEVGLGKANLVSDEEPRFYYVRAKDTGSVDRVRELSPEPSSPELLAAIRQLIFPQVRPQGKPIPCVYFVMMRLDSEGIPVFYRSNSDEMFFRMSELFPESFPVAPAVTAAQAARAAAMDAIRP